MADARRHHTISWREYLSWPSDERFELIDGEAYAMSPAPGRRHQEARRAMFRHMDRSLAPTPCEVYFAP